MEKESRERNVCSAMLFDGDARSFIPGSLPGCADDWIAANCAATSEPIDTQRCPVGPVQPQRVAEFASCCPRNCQPPPSTCHQLGRVRSAICLCGPSVFPLSAGLLTCKAGFCAGQSLLHPSFGQDFLEQFVMLVELSAGLAI
jgi:hypothetical protein